MISTQASIAAACYAIVILTTRLSGKERLSTKALNVAGAVVAAFVGVCVINCYVSGDCGVLAWAFTGMLLLATTASLALVYGDVVARKKENLVVRDDIGALPVPMGATPP
jgi:hypothetical protein